ncbi:MAG: hypothetical protein ACJ76H_13720 [Bacteriovoracaceae bacterium]
MKSLAVLFLLISSFSLFAQGTGTRWIDIEWEEVKGASSYEVELFEDKSGTLVPRGKHKVESAEWSNAVPPGKYSLRMRSLDKRGVPGEWSDYIPVKVRMHNPQLFHPAVDAKVTTPNVDFEWSDIEGAALYQLVVKTDSDKIIHNAIVRDVRASIYLEDLGTYLWTVYALEEGEAQISPEDFTSASFKTFTRVGGELDSPEVKVTLGEKITIDWALVRRAKLYEVDYLPPAQSDKNRRFKIPGNTFSFAPSRLKEGVTTLTVRSTAPGYPDSVKSTIQLSKKGNEIEIQDIIQGQKDEAPKVSPSLLLWRDEFYISTILSRFAYSSTDIGTDTELKQKDLTGVGLAAEWIRKPKLNSLQQKYDLSYLQLTSGREVGTKIRGSFSLSKERALGKGRISYGGGATLLRVPSFFGDRLEDDIFVKQSTSLGPHLLVSYTSPLSTYWAWQANAMVSYQMFYLQQEKDGGKSFPWYAVNGRALYYITRKEAIFAGLEYERWAQNWSGDKSQLAGFSLTIGLKAGF